jgi:hypothetical protein
MQSPRERTTLTEKRGGYVHRTKRAKTSQRLSPSAPGEDRSTLSISEEGKRVRTSESVPYEPFLWIAAHQVSRWSGGLPGERRTVARTIFAPSCPMLSSIAHQGMEHIQV